MSHTSTLLIITILAITLTTHNPSTNAQENKTMTPTEAPTKTPTPTNDKDTTTAQPNPPQQTQPLGQHNLNLLTGNVQRPNGIAWLNNTVYTSCTGDQTIYEINQDTGDTTTYIGGINNAHTLHPEEINGQINLWIPDFQSDRLLHYNKQTNQLKTITTNLEGPWGISPLDDDEFLITNLRGNNTIIANKNGNTSEVINNLLAPTGITHDSNYIYIANNGSTRRAIEWYSIEDIRTAQSTGKPIDNPENHSLVSGLQNTTGLTLASDSYLYFAYSLGTRGVIGRVNPQQCRENRGCTNEQVEVIILTELAAPLAGLTISPEMRLFIHTMFSPDIYWVQIDTTHTQQ